MDTCAPTRHRKARWSGISIRRETTPPKTGSQPREDRSTVRGRLWWVECSSWVPAMDSWVAYRGMCCWECLWMGNSAAAACAARRMPLRWTKAKQSGSAALLRPSEPGDAEHGWPPCSASWRRVLASLDASTRLRYISCEIETLGAGLVGDFEGVVVLEHRHDLVGKEPHVAFALFVGHSAVTELRDEMVHPALAHHRSDLFEHLIRGACRVQTDEEVNGLVLDLRVRELRIGLRHLGVELVALYALQMPVGEVIVLVDRIEHRAHMHLREFLCFVVTLAHANVDEADRRTGRNAHAQRGFAIALHVLAGGVPVALRDDQHAEAEPGHDFGRLGAYGRRVEAALGMGDGARADRHFGNLEKFTVVREALLAERHDNDFRRLDETRSRLVHRNAKALILDGRGAAAKAEDAAPAREHIEHRDLLGDTDRVVPWQDDDGGAECHILGASAEVGHQLNHVGAHRIAGEMVLDAPDGVEAERLGEVGQAAVVVVDLAIRLLTDVEHADRSSNFHSESPSDVIGVRYSASPLSPVSYTTSGV